MVYLWFCKDNVENLGQVDYRLFKFVVVLYSKGLSDGQGAVQVNYYYYESWGIYREEFQIVENFVEEFFSILLNSNILYFIQWYDDQSFQQVG